MHNFASHQVVNATPSPACVRGEGPSSHGGSTTPQSATTAELIRVVHTIDRLTDKVKEIQDRNQGIGEGHSFYQHH